MSSLFNHYTSLIMYPTPLPVQHGHVRGGVTQFLPPEYRQVVDPHDSYVCWWLQLSWNWSALSYILLSISLSGEYTFPLLRANHAIINETDAVLRNEERRWLWNCGEWGTDSLCLAFRAMGKGLNNITTETIKAYLVLCRNSSLWDLALNLESWGDMYPLSQWLLH